ncbi:MobH family relaxase [Rheinheimera sp.]|uniref:MobH family relaxase n=1 Tax=Rheinheimera sp. TaxID=1869214 RepID=UPI00404851AA
MLKGLVEYVSLGFISLRPKKEAVHRDIYGREVEHADDFFHPQKFRGIPVFDADSILMHYKPQLQKLREVVDIGDHRLTPDGKPLFDELFTNIIKRFIGFVHMIPASEDHHHSNTGGLLTHSIEASIEALRWSKELKCQVTHMPDLDAKIKPVIDYSSWLGALLHDIGKIMRDISVDAVEVIHPFTKRPIPMTAPILSWHPQKESLTDWAKNNNVSAYGVTWLRHRTHNRHNIDSGQILQPLLHGTYALDYLLSSPVKQEVYSELVRCLSGYTHQKGHLSDCMRMGDSVSTNRALSIQYDPVRGQRRVSTATKLYHCINHARKEWDWNRPKSQGWIIGSEAYVRWSSAIDAIISASIEHQYGLPTDTRNVLTIMESNGFTHLFDSDSPNDRILKFCPGNFTPAQRNDIVSGKKPVTWIDLIKMVTPHVVFGENPIPPSMSGIIYLPNANLFHFVNKDGDIQPLNPLQGVTAPTDNEAITGHNDQPELPQQRLFPQTPIHESEEGQAPSKPEQSETKPPAKTKNKKKQSAKPTLVPSLPGPASKKSSLNAELFGAPNEHSQPAVKPTNVGMVESNTVNQTNDESAYSNTANPQAQSVNDSEKGSTSNPLANEKPKQGNTSKTDSQANIIPKGIAISPTFQSILDNKVALYKTSQHVFIDAVDAENKLSTPLSDILKSLKTANEILLNPMAPAIMTQFHVVEGEKKKCISISHQLVRLFAGWPVGSHNISVNESIAEQVGDATQGIIQNGEEPDNSNIESSSTSEQQEHIHNGQENIASLNENDGTPNAQNPIVKPVEKSLNESKPESSTSANNGSSFIPAALPTIQLTHDMLMGFISPKTAHRYDGHIYLNVDYLCEALSFTVPEALLQLHSIQALYVTPLEPKPELISRKRNGKSGQYVKLSELFDSALPQRGKPKDGNQAAVSEKEEKQKTPENDPNDFTLSLQNLAAGAHPNSLIAFLASKNAKGLLTYLEDGKIAIELSAIPPASYRPVSKSKLLHHLLNNGGVKQGPQIHLTQEDLLKINVENI